MEAMSPPRADSSRPPIARLWQLPLMLLALGLFALSAFLLIHPKAKQLTLDQRFEHIAQRLKNDRPDAAMEALRDLRNAGPLAPDADARAHLLEAEAIDLEQHLKKLDLATNDALIIDHTKKAVAGGIKPDATMLKRIAGSYEALGRTKDAIENYRRAITLDPDKALPLERKIIDLQLAHGDDAAADLSLTEYLKDKRLTGTERAWALGERSRILVDRGDFATARSLLADAVKIDADPVAQGQVNYHLGYCEWKLGNAKEAERLLRVARDQLRVQHPLDADAAQLLGRILQDHGQFREALSFYQEVIVGHPDSPVAPLARLGRGVCRIALGEDEPGLNDLHELVTDISARPSRARYRTETLEGLEQSEQRLAKREKYQGTMELMALEQTLTPEPPPDFLARLGTVLEKRADQVGKTVAAATTDAERVQRQQQARKLLTQAGDAFVGYARAVTLDNDSAHGEALWRGIDLYDRAGDLQRAIGALELFVAERPTDPKTPDALLRLGRTYQAMGMFDQAIAAYQKNIFRYEKSLAASRSGVPLAQAYVAKGPEWYGKAEKALKATLESQLNITPEAEDFRNALFELAQLYYRTGRFEESISRFSEFADRYPKEDRLPQVLFLMADSYRKSAGLLKAVATATTRPTTDPSTGPTAVASSSSTSANDAATRAEVAAARRERLDSARAYYDRVIDYFKVAPPERDLDRLYVKLAHFYRADCLYDNGSYDEAIRLYDAAALRYQDDPSSLAAYVQIVNAYLALGRPDDAKVANERAKWLLRRMPADAFKDGKFALPKKYWEDWLAWSSNAGMW